LAVTDGDKGAFLQAVAASLGDGTFVKLTLGKPGAAAGDVTKVQVSPVTLKGKPCLKFVFTHKTKDVTDNKPVDEGIGALSNLLGELFLSATLFSTAHDVTLTYNKRNEPRMTKAKPSLVAPASAQHDKVKPYAIDPARPYLVALDLTFDDGRVKPSMYPKFRQVAHFIEIIAPLIRASPLQNQNALTVLDIGSGKGYLTFALYDYLTVALGKRARVTGIEVRAELVTWCSNLAVKLKFDGLTFEAAKAADTVAERVDMLIALHACDTATDDAIFHGIAGEAAVIVVAPCCQHELAPQLNKPDEALAGLMKFGLFKQRQADLVTDAARCLLMEAHGYSVKVIEFVSSEHTAKNLIISGVRSNAADRARARAQYAALKDVMKFDTQHLERRLAGLKVGGQ
jgi:SAM-dependent methyltransferase